MYDRKGELEARLGWLRAQAYEEPSPALPKWTEICGILSFKAAPN